MTVDILSREEEDLATAEKQRPFTIGPAMSGVLPAISTFAAPVSGGVVRYTDPMLNMVFTSFRVTCLPAGTAWDQVGVRFTLNAIPRVPKINEYRPPAGPVLTALVNEWLHPNDRWQEALDDVVVARLGDTFNLWFVNQTAGVVWFDWVLGGYFVRSERFGG
jgi:hypothetical protein